MGENYLNQSLEQIKKHESISKSLKKLLKTKILIFIVFSLLLTITLIFHAFIISLISFIISLYLWVSIIRTRDNIDINNMVLSIMNQCKDNEIRNSFR